jgi:tetratricopeptide (TPR) repeat protein
MKNIVFIPLFAVWGMVFLAQFSSVSAQQTEESDYSRGKTYYDMQNYSAAISQWEKWLVNYPDSKQKSRVWYWLGHSNLTLAKTSRTNGNSAAAEQYGQKALGYFSEILDQKDSEDPFYPETLFCMGELIFSKGDVFLQTGREKETREAYRQAKNYLNDLCTKFPDNSKVPEALKRLGFIVGIYEGSYSQSEADYRQGIAFFDEAIKKSSVSPGSSAIKSYCTFYQAFLYGRLGESTRAISMFRNFVQQKDRLYGPSSLYEIANIYFEKNQKDQYQQAVSELKNIPVLFPEFPALTIASDVRTWHDSQLLLVKAYEKLEQYPNAAKTLEDVIFTIGKPGHPAASQLVSDQIYLFDLYLKNKNNSSAKNLLEELERSGVMPEEVRLLRAKLLEAHADYTSAMVLLRELLGVQTTYAGQLQIRKTPSSASPSASSLSVPSFFEACRILALCYAKTGQNALAFAVTSSMASVLDSLNWPTDCAAILEDTQNELGTLTAGTSYPPGYNGSTGLPSGAAWTSLPQTIDPISPAGTADGTSGEGVSSFPKLTEEEQRNKIKRGNSYRVAGRNDDALKEYLAVVENDSCTQSNRAAAGLKSGEILLEQGRNEEANACFELILAECGGTVEALEASCYLGLAAVQDSDYKTAKTRFYPVLSRDNNQYGTALYHLALIELDEKNRTQYLQHLNTLFEQCRGSLYWSHAGWYLAAESYYTGAYDKAEEILDDILKNSPDSVILDRVLYLKGRLAQNRGHYETASLAYKTLLKLGNDSPLLEEAQTALAECQTR